MEADSGEAHDAPSVEAFGPMSQPADGLNGDNAESCRRGPANTAGYV